MQLSSQIDSREPLSNYDDSGAQVGQNNDYDGLDGDDVYTISMMQQAARPLLPITNMMNYEADLGHDWRNITLPSDIHSLLSGFPSY